MPNVENTNQIILVDADDWSAIYVNGKKYTDDHTSNVMNDLPTILESHQPFVYDKQWADNSEILMEGFPEDLVNVILNSK